MADNARHSVRVTENFRGDLFHAGQVAACEVLDVSAGGARFVSELRVNVGAHCTLGFALAEELASAASITDPYVSFHLEVLERTPCDAGFSYRARNLTREGSAEYERAVRVVFAVQREHLARTSGAAESSPMAMDAARREHRRSRSRIIARFWRR